MKKLNRLILFFVIVAMLLSMAGCSGDVTYIIKTLRKDTTELAAAASADILSSVMTAVSVPVVTPDAEPINADFPANQNGVAANFCYNNILNSKEKKLYAILYKNFNEFKTEISVSDYNLSFSSEDEIESAVDNAICAVLYDHPEIFWYKTQCSYTYLSGYNLECLNVFPIYTQKEANIMKTKVETAAENVVADTESMNQYEISKYIYTYIIQNTEYGYGTNEENAYTLAGVFADGKAVCEGYAKAYIYLMNKCGLSAVFIRGVASDSYGSGSHAWNIAEINGNWYQVDCTWGDPIMNTANSEERKMNVNYAYLHVTDKDLSLTHSVDDFYASAKPACTATDDNYYVKEALYFEKFDESVLSEKLKLKLHEINKEKGAKIDMKFESYDEMQKAENWIKSNFLNLTYSLENRVRSYAYSSTQIGTIELSLYY